MKTWRHASFSIGAATGMLVVPSLAFYPWPFAVLSFMAAAYLMWAGTRAVAELAYVEAVKELADYETK